MSKDNPNTIEDEEYEAWLKQEKQEMREMGLLHEPNSIEDTNKPPDHSTNPVVTSSIADVLHRYATDLDDEMHSFSNPKRAAALERIAVATLQRMQDEAVAEARIQEVARMSQFGGERLAPYINEYQIKRFAAIQALRTKQETE